MKPMLRCTLALAVLLAASVPGHASAQFGLRGGVNLSRFVGADASDESTAGLNLGASVPLVHIGPVSLVPEVYYAQKGGTTLYPAQTAAVEFDLSYLEVPVLVRLGFPIGAGFRGYVGGGPAYAWNLECKFTPASDPNSVASECGQPFQSFDTAMKSADKGIHFNAGVDLPVLGGFGGLNLDARLVRGLDRVIDTEGSGEEDVKNQSFTLMLGYYLGR